jgi:hypothetical protein
VLARTEAGSHAQGHRMSVLSAGPGVMMVMVVPVWTRAQTHFSSPLHCSCVSPCYTCFLLMVCACTRCCHKKQLLLPTITTAAVPCLGQQVADVLTHVDSTSGAVSKALRVSASIPTDCFCLVRV